MIESNCARLGCAAQSRYHRERRIGLVQSGYEQRESRMDAVDIEIAGR